MATKYEAIIILNPDLQESKVKEEETRVTELLKANGATAVTATRWGKKPIAYKVKKFKQGHWILFNFESEQESKTSPTLTAQLRLMENVIKFQTHVIGQKTRKFKGNPLRKQDDYADDLLDGEFEY